MSHHGGRPPARIEGLDILRILDAAMTIVDADGIDALSMRRLGKQLGVDPMAIYYHLPSKQAVIGGLVQRVFAEIEVSLERSGDARWQDQVRFWANTYRQIAQRHRNLILHLVSNADAAGPALMRVNEHLYAALSESGLPPRDVMQAADAIVDYLHGVLLPGPVGSESALDWRERFQEQARDPGVTDTPTIDAVVNQLELREMAPDPEFGLELLITGLEQRLAGQP